MGKDNQENVCFNNLLSNKGGKYVRNKLKFLKNVESVSSWSESPDFLVVDNGKAIGFEHFLFDQTYIGERAGSRVKDEETWKMYEKYHKALIEGTYNSDEAAAALEKVIQRAFDISQLFDYETCMEQFERVFDKHVKKIPDYINNLHAYKEKDLFFLVEVSSLFMSNHTKIIRCVARREDDAVVFLGGNHIVLTERIIRKIESQIGILKGVILQNYSFFDLEKHIEDMVYLDTTSLEALHESIKSQKIQIYKEYFVYAPKIRTKVNLVK